jgi:hypothetical protein
VRPVRTLLPCVALLLTGAAGAATPAVTVPAEWRSFDIIVGLRALPATYSCDDLWYKFRDLLLTLGARAYMTITPYRCGATGGSQGRAPSVHLQFQLPQPLHGDATRYEQISAVTRTIRLKPGTPPTLKAADCELVRQLKSALYDALPVRVTTAEFTCKADGGSFVLAAEAVVEQPEQAATASAPLATPHP